MKEHMARLIIFAILTIILSIPILAANVDVQLDTNDGTSGLVIKNASQNGVATIDSWGRITATAPPGYVPITGTSVSGTVESQGTLGSLVWGAKGAGGFSTGGGVQGVATNTSGMNFGVYGQTFSSNGYAFYGLGGRNYFSGNVGIGTTNPVSSLEVNGDLKLAARSMPTPAAGKIYFDSSTKRLNYHDGSMWIEVDPAYTTKETMATESQNTPANWLITHTVTFANIPAIADPTKRIIITGVCGSMINGGNANYTYLIDIKNNSAVKTSFRVSNSTSGGSGQAYFNFIKSFPIPIKIASTDQALQITITGNGTFVGSGFAIDYIILPL